MNRSFGFLAIILMLVTGFTIGTQLAKRITTSPEKEKTKSTEWKLMPNGIVVIKKAEHWIAYNFARVPCSTKIILNTDRKFLLKSKKHGGLQACYLVDTNPIGYFKGHPEKTNARFVSSVVKTYPFKKEN